MTAMLTKQIVDICKEYARLECLARWNERFGRDPRYVQIFRSSSLFLIEAAPTEAQPWLDTLKRIFEIDRAVLDPDIVLMRASVDRVHGLLNKNPET